MGTLCLITFNDLLLGIVTSINSSLCPTQPIPLIPSYFPDACFVNAYSTPGRQVSTGFLMRLHLYSLQSFIF